MQRLKSDVVDVKRTFKNVCNEAVGDVVYTFPYDVTAPSENWFKPRVEEHGVIRVLVVERQGA